MTHAFLLRLSFGLALVAALTLGASPRGPEASGETVTAVSATHQVTIQYLDARGDYRRAKIAIEPLRRDARAPWRGRLQAVHIDGLKPLSTRDAARFREAGFEQTAEFLSSGHTTGSNILMPAPSNLKRIWLRGERGSIVSFRIRTENHNPSTYGEGDGGDDGGDKPADPNPGEDGGDDGDGGDDDDDGDDDKTCTGAADCVGIFNPWTCVCEPDIVDPWGGDSRFQSTEGAFSF